MSMLNCDWKRALHKQKQRKFSAECNAAFHLNVSELNFNYYMAVPNSVTIQSDMGIKMVIDTEDL